MLKNYNTAGIEIKPAFLYPCPVRCGMTGGCPSCRIWENLKSSDISIPKIDRIPFVIENEISPEEEHNFYKKAFETHNL